MKKLNLFLLLFILLKSNILFAQKSKKEKAAKEYKKIVFSITDKYLPDMYQQVIDGNYCGPDCYRSYVVLDNKQRKYIPWNMEVSESIVYGKIGTIIHESVHGFNNGPWRTTVNKNGKKSVVFKGRLLISDDEELSYEGNELIKSYKIVDDMLNDHPKIKELTRFDTYIDVGSNGNVSSNLSGLYGLMDEFSAYYHGCNTTFIIYNDLKNNRITTNDDLTENLDNYWSEGNQYNGLFKGGNLKSSETEKEVICDSLRYIEEGRIIDELASDCMGHYASYYEFNIFIGAYLKYVKENHHSMYYEILNNDNLRKAYNTIDENFHQLVTNMEREFGDGYKQITLLSNGFRWTIKTGVENRDNGKNILIHYQDILNEFKHYDGDVKVINETSQARSIVLINNIQDFEFTDDAIEVFRHPLMLGTHPIKIVTSKGSFSVNQKEFDKYILPLYTPTHNGVKWAHR